MGTKAMVRRDGQVPRARRRSCAGWPRQADARPPADPRWAGRGGAICLFASLTLALAAGTFGISSGPVRDHAHWTPAFLQGHGGAIGEALYVVSHRLVQDVGVDILVIFLLLGGVIMLTGASLAGALAAAATGLVRASRGLRLLAERPVRADGGQWSSVAEHEHG